MACGGMGLHIRHQKAKKVPPTPPTSATGSGLDGGWTPFSRGAFVTTDILSDPCSGMICYQDGAGGGHGEWHESDERKRQEQEGVGGNRASPCGD